MARLCIIKTRNFIFFLITLDEKFKISKFFLFFFFLFPNLNLFTNGNFQILRVICKRNFRNFRFKKSCAYYKEDFDLDLPRVQHQKPRDEIFRLRRYVAEQFLGKVYLAQGYVLKRFLIGFTAERGESR